MDIEISQEINLRSQGQWGSCWLNSSCSFMEGYTKSGKSLSVDFYFFNYLKDGFIDAVNEGQYYLGRDPFMRNDSLFHEGGDEKSFERLIKKYGLVYDSDVFMNKLVSNTLIGKGVFSYVFSKLIKEYNLELARQRLSFLEELSINEIWGKNILELKKSLNLSKRWESSSRTIGEFWNSTYDWYDEEYLDPEVAFKLKNFKLKMKEFSALYTNKTQRFFSKYLSLGVEVNGPNESWLENYSFQNLYINQKNKNLVVEKIVGELTKQNPVLLSYSVPLQNRKFKEDALIFKYDESFQDPPFGSHMVIIKGIKLNDKNEIEFVKIQNSYGRLAGAKGNQYFDSNTFYTLGQEIHFLDKN